MATLSTHHVLEMNYTHATGVPADLDFLHDIRYMEILAESKEDAEEKVLRFMKKMGAEDPTVRIA